MSNTGGITRSVSARIKISEDPLIYMLDTPGILAPTIHEVENGLKLALVGCLVDHLVGPQLLADYLLFWLNKHQYFSYATKLGLSTPQDDIIYLLTFIAAKYQMTQYVKNYDGQRVERPNLDLAANYFVNCWRKGEFGLYCLDQDMLEPSKLRMVKEI